MPSHNRKPSPRAIAERVEDMGNFHLLLTGELTDWERDFLTSIRKAAEWTAPQRAHYFKIRDKYLKSSAGACPPPPAPDQSDLPPHARDHDHD